MWGSLQIRYLARSCKSGSMRTFLALGLMAMMAYPAFVSAGLSGNNNRILSINDIVVKREEIDDSGQLIGLEDELSAIKPCEIKFPDSLEQKKRFVSTENRFPGKPVIKIEGDAPIINPKDDTPTGFQQLEFVTDPFPPTQDNLVDVLLRLKTLAKTIKDWRKDGPNQITPWPQGVELNREHMSSTHACQATIDMKFSMETLDAVRDHIVNHKKKETPILDAAKAVFEKCIAPTAKASDKSNKHKWETFTVKQKYGLFFKIFQGLVAFTRNKNTLKSNEKILFKFSYASRENFIDKSSDEAKAASGVAYDLVEEYSNKAKFVKDDGGVTYVKTCVYDEVEQWDGDQAPWYDGNGGLFEVALFKAYWENPTYENDPYTNPGLPTWKFVDGNGDEETFAGTGNIHTQIKPKFNSRHEITRVAFELRESNLVKVPGSGWPSVPEDQLQGPAKQLMKFCQLAWPDDGASGDGDVAAPVDLQEADLPTSRSGYMRRAPPSVDN